MQPNIIYLGDAAIDRQASYLAGVMSWAGLDYDYIGSKEPYPEPAVAEADQLMILSDYPAANFSAAQTEKIMDRIHAGMGLLMIGGWNSFTGSGGGYHQSLFAKVLPVALCDRDDRTNFSGPCMVIKERDHAILGSLPFDQNAPAIGGLNAFTAKPGSACLLSAVAFQAKIKDTAIDFQQAGRYPLLVIGQYGRGKTAAFASDVAPHWVGPFVDWGDRRIQAKAPGSRPIEVGNWYADFFVSLIKWLSDERTSLSAGENWNDAY